MKKGQLRQLLLSIPAGIVVFLVLWLGLHWHFLLCAVLAVGIYLAIYFLLTPKPDRNVMYFASRPDGEEMAASMREAWQDLQAIRKAADQITDIPTQHNAQQLAKTGEHIYQYLHDQPEKIPTARRFLTYYLDTVGRILEQYIKYQQSGLHTSEVRAFQNKVRAVLPKLKAGFDEQLTQLMASERFDVEADMKVVEGLLDTEGFACSENAES